MSTPVPTPYNAAASYRNFGQELLRMIQSGQITPERANQLKANVYEATRLGNTAQGQQAMNAAIGAARDALPMKGYDPAAMYRNIGSQLANAVKSGRMTVQQAQALQAPLFAAVKLGNTAPGYAQMNSAYNNAISAIRNASPAQPQGGLTQAQPQEVVRPPYATLMMPTPQNGIAPQIKQQTPTQAQVDAYYAGNPDMNNSYWNPYAGSFETRPQVPQPMPVTQPPEIVVTGQRMPEIVAPPPPPMPMPPMPPRMPEIVTPPPSPYPAQPPMALPGGTGYDEQGNMIRSKPDYLSGIGSLLANFGKGMGNAPMQPDFIGKHFTGTAPPPGMKYIETSEGLVPVPINDVPVRPAMGPGLGGSLGMTMQGAAPQPVSAPQGMAMGGLLRKYYGGGMC